MCVCVIKTIYRIHYILAIYRYNWLSVTSENIKKWIQRNEMDDTRQFIHSICNKYTHTIDTVENEFHFKEEIKSLFFSLVFFHVCLFVCLSGCFINLVINNFHLILIRFYFLLLLVFLLPKKNYSTITISMVDGCGWKSVKEKLTFSLPEKPNKIENMRILKILNDSRSCSI